MAFRVRNTKNTINQVTNKDIDIKDFKLELDNIANTDKYVPNDTFNSFINENNVLKRINKKKSTNNNIEKETLFYDQTTSQWIIVKESELNLYKE